MAESSPLNAALARAITVALTCQQGISVHRRAASS
jgi:hypothetical protein